MKKNKAIVIAVIIVIIILTLIFIKNMTKKIKYGNTMSSQEIVDRILNLNSYKAKVYVLVKSNKNQNKYILSQEYNTENGSIQEVLEPANISGIKIIKKNDVLKIQNTELNLKTIFENYKGLENNGLDLSNFIKDYKENNNSNFEENNEGIILKTIGENNEEKNLYIKKDNASPTKLIIKDNNHKRTIIIEYNEIELY